MVDLLDTIHVRYETGSLHMTIRPGDVLVVGGNRFVITRARKHRLRPYLWSITASMEMTARRGAVVHRVVLGPVFAPQPVYGPETATQGERL